MYVHDMNETHQSKQKVPNSKLTITIIFTKQQITRNIHVHKVIDNKEKASKIITKIIRIVKRKKMYVCVCVSVQRRGLVHSINSLTHTHTHTDRIYMYNSAITNNPYIQNTAELYVHECRNTCSPFVYTYKQTYTHTNTRKHE